MADRTPIVEPKDWQAIGNDALTMVIVFGTATLRGGILNDAVAKLQTMPPLPQKRRQKIMDEINKGIRANPAFGRCSARSCDADQCAAAGIVE